MTVTFFGHSDAPWSVKKSVKKIITDLIENCGADVFYVGHNGNFDMCVMNVLREVQTKYKFVKFYVVLAYMPQQENGMINGIDCDNTIFPEDVAKGLPKFAISRRNDWMIRKSDVVVTYVERSCGGASKYREKAVKQGKTVIDLA